MKIVNKLSNRAKSLSNRRLAVSAAIVFAASTLLHASGLIQPYRLINVHTAGVLPRAYFDVDFRIYASRGAYGAGLITGANVGITDRLNIGLAYGGEGVIGYSDNARWNGFPGVLVKYRLFEEKFVTPALTVGFDNQGYGGPAREAVYGYEGYIYKSPGFFVALSKNYLIFRTIQIGFHGTVNYSLEEASDVAWPNFAVGADIGINEELMFVVEYDAALNDITGPNNDKYYGQLRRGFLNLGLRWAFTESFLIEFDFMDIFENKTRGIRIPGANDGKPINRAPIRWGRELKVAYISRF